MSGNSIFPGQGMIPEPEQKLKEQDSVSSAASRPGTLSVVADVVLADSVAASNHNSRSRFHTLNTQDADQSPARELMETETKGRYHIPRTRSRISILEAEIEKLKAENRRMEPGMPSALLQNLRKQIKQGSKRRDDEQVTGAFNLFADRSKGVPSLSKDQCRQALEHLEVFGGIEMDDVFRTFDINEDGSLDFEEFKHLLQSSSHVEEWAESLRLHHILADALPRTSQKVHESKKDDLEYLTTLRPEEIGDVVTAFSEQLRIEIVNAIEIMKRALKADIDLKKMSCSDHGKFSVFTMNAGFIEDFHAGLSGRIGYPNLDFFNAMEAEHCTKAGFNKKFTSGNYHICTSPSKEWRFVVGQSCHGHNMKHKRRHLDVDSVFKGEVSRTAALTKAEVVSVILYTGPMFQVYNAVLRRFPEDEYDFFERNGNLFSTTIFVLVSAVQKISRSQKLPEGLLLYRGLGGKMELPESFYKAREKGAPKGYAEWGFMSTTSDKSVALQYSGVSERKPRPIVLVFRISAVDRGANISELSQYPGEKEYLFVPLSYVESNGPSFIEFASDGVIMMVPVRINANLKTLTTEELRNQKKSSHIATFEQVIEEVRVYLDSRKDDANHRLGQDPHSRPSYHNGIITNYEKFTVKSLNDRILKQCKEYLDKHRKLPSDKFVDDASYKKLVQEMLEIKTDARFKMDHWIEDTAQYIDVVFSKELKQANRDYMAYLIRSLPKAQAERNSLALRICNLKGLIVDDFNDGDQLNEKAIASIVADGISSQDLKLLVDAGANVTQSNIFMIAAGNGQADCLKVLAELRADVNSEVNGRSALAAAAGNGHADCVKLLGELKADISKYGKECASIAAENGHADCVMHLAKMKAEVSDTFGYSSCLQKAAMNGHVECVKLLVALKADVNRTDRTNNSEITPLMLAAKHGHFDCIKCLLEWKAMIHMTTRSGSNAVMLAAENGHVECTNLLITADNVESGIENHGNDLAEQDTSTKDGNIADTAVLNAARQGHTECVKILVDKFKAKVGYTSIMLAAQNGHRACADDLVQILKGIGPYFGLGLRKTDLRSSLIIATQNGHAECIDFLIEQHASACTVSDDGSSLLMIASQNGHIQCFDCLINKYKAKIEQQRSKDGKTAIMLASQNGHLTCVLQLIAEAKGHLISQMEGSGSNYRVSEADSHGCETGISLLVIDQEDIEGENALFMAVQGKHWDIAESLVRIGGLNLLKRINAAKRTCIEYALEDGHADSAWRMAQRVKPADKEDAERFLEQMYDKVKMDWNEKSIENMIERFGGGIRLKLGPTRMNSDTQHLITFSGNGLASARARTYCPSYKSAYYEVHIVELGPYCTFGFCSENWTQAQLTTEDGLQHTGVGCDDFSWGWGRTPLNTNVAPNLHNTLPLAHGSVVGLTYEHRSGTLQITLNGSPMPQYTRQLRFPQAISQLYPVMTCVSCVLRCNFISSGPSLPHNIGSCPLSFQNLLMLNHLDPPKVCMEVLKAAILGQTRRLQLLAGLKADITITYKGDGPLMLAAKHGQSDCLRLLASLLASPSTDGIQDDKEKMKRHLNERDSLGYLPIMQATMNRHATCVRLLVELHASLEASSQELTPLTLVGLNGHPDFAPQKMTPLMLASWNGHADFVMLLVELRAKPDDSNADRHYTPLMLAAIKNNVQCVGMLVECGANVNKEGKYRRTPLMLAALNGHSECVKLLLGLQASADLKTVKGCTALMLASLNGQSRCIELLSYALVNETDSTPQQTPEKAVVQSVPRSALGVQSYQKRTNRRELPEYKELAKERVNQSNGFGFTPLMCLVEGLLLQIDWELSFGIFRHDSKMSQRMSLRTTDSVRYVLCLKCLVELQADVMQSDNIGETVLFKCTHPDLSDIAELLIDAGKLDLLRKEDAGNNTYLHHAISQGYPSIELAKHLARRMGILGLKLYDKVESKVSKMVIKDQNNIPVMEEFLGPPGTVRTRQEAGHNFITFRSAFSSVRGSSYCPIRMKAYYEVRILKPGPVMIFGFCSDEWLPEGVQCNSAGVGCDSASWGVRGALSLITGRSSTGISCCEAPVPVDSDEVWKEEYIVGLACDLVSRTWQWSINGEWMPSMDLDQRSLKCLFPALSCSSSIVECVFKKDCWKYGPPGRNDKAQLGCFESFHELAYCCCSVSPKDEWEMTMVTTRTGSTVLIPAVEHKATRQTSFEDASFSVNSGPLRMRPRQKMNWGLGIELGGETPFRLGCELFQAISDGRDVGLIKLLLKLKAEMNQRACDGFTPLMLAAEKGRDDYVTHILNHRADVMVADQFGETALSRALYNGHKKVIEQLIAVGRAELMGMLDKSGRASLHYGLQRGLYQFLKQVIGQFDENGLNILQRAKTEADRSTSVAIFDLFRGPSSDAFFGSDSLASRRRLVSLRGRVFCPRGKKAYFEIKVLKRDDIEREILIPQRMKTSKAALVPFLASRMISLKVSDLIAGFVSDEWMPDGVDEINPYTSIGADSTSCSWGVTGYSTKSAKRKHLEVSEQPWKEGVVIGLACDLVKGIVHCSVDGEWGEKMYLDEIPRCVFPAISLASCEVQCNITKASWKHKPPPLKEEETISFDSFDEHEENGCLVPPKCECFDVVYESRAISLEQKDGQMKSVYVSVPRTVPKETNAVAMKKVLVNLKPQPDRLPESESGEATTVPVAVPIYDAKMIHMDFGQGTQVMQVSIPRLTVIPVKSLTDDCHSKI